MSIQSELEKIRAYTASPSNEAETCHWVIVPLLEACGYARHEINSQNPDGAGRYPDFTILTGTEHQWFLEAKAWNVTLADSHINQAIFSAYSTGRRWVVLSNGREWRLYDASVHAPTPGDRLVAKASITEGEDFDQFLEAISKQSVVSGRILDFAAENRVREVIAEQLSSKDTLLVKRITEILRKELKVPNASQAAVYASLTKQVIVVVPPPVMPEPRPIDPQPPGSGTGKPAGNGPKYKFDFTPADQVEAEKKRLIGHYCGQVGVEFEKKSKSQFWTADSAHSDRLVCTVSKTYPDGGHWYAYHPGWDEFLSGGKARMVAFATVNANRGFLIPRDWLAGHLEELGKSENFWHIVIRYVDGDPFLYRKAGFGPLSIKEFMVKLA